MNDLVAAIKKEGGEAVPYSLDASDEDNVKKVVATVEKDLGPIEMCLCNVSGFSAKRLIDTSVAEFEQTWTITTKANFMVGKEVALVMEKKTRKYILRVHHQVHVQRLLLLHLQWRNELHR
eukprot:UN06695